MGRDFENRKNSIFKTAGVKSKIYSRYGKMLYVVAKNGIPDPDANPSLRSLIEKAKKDQVPAHVIEKAIEKARGLGGENFATARFEAFGPAGSLIIVDCLTDNNQRTVSDIMSYFTKTSSKAGKPGSVAMWFDHLAVLTIKSDKEDEALEALIGADVDVSELENKGGKLTIYVSPNDFFKAKTALTQAFPGVEFETQEITFLPQSLKELGPDDLAQFQKLLGLLNEHDDVQEIYHNVAL